MNHLSCDIETAGKLDPRDGPIDQLGFGVGRYRCFREKYTEAHRSEYQAIFDSARRIVFHNGTFDLPYLRYYRYDVPIERYEDTILGFHMLNPDLPLGLETVNSIYSHFRPWWNKKKGQSLTEQWTNPLYHAHDLVSTWIAWQGIELDLHREGKWRLYRDESVPVAYACMRLKQEGIRINVDLMERMRLVWCKKIDEIEKALDKFAHINWSSSQQVRDLLYKQWNLPPQYERTVRGPALTSNEKALEKLMVKTEHPAVKLLVYLRKLSRQRSNYLEYKVDDKGFYHFDIAFLNATGRARGELLTMQRGPIRSIFIPDEPGWKFASADWERVELYIGAVVSGDTHYLDILNNTQFHEYAGKLVLKEDVTKKGTPLLYERVKNISHGTAYGRGAPAISREYDIPIRDVTDYQLWLEHEFPIWWQWRLNQVRTADKEGRLTNSFGFTRYFWSGNTSGMALCMEPQSDVAHMVKRTMLRCQAELPKPCRVVFPFHDNLTITYPEEMEEQALECLRANMEREWPELHNWKGKSDIKTGYNLQEVTG